MFIYQIEGDEPLCVCFEIESRKCVRWWEERGLLQDCSRNPEEMANLVD